VGGVVPVPLAKAFPVVVEELRQGLARAGVDLVPGPDGTVSEGGVPVGRVEEWTPPELVRISWQLAPWTRGKPTEVELRCEAVGGGTRVTLEHRGGAATFEDGGESTGWVATAFLAPFLKSLAPQELGDWVTDRNARRPSGDRARKTYSDPIYHRPNFALLLESLELGPHDRLLEVGCGGGAFLQEALRSGCRATAVDHSAEMVRTARENNREAVDAGRLEVLEGDARHLPVPDDTFTSAVSTGMVNFLPDPSEMFREVHRALVMGGRFALFSGTRELAGTPACPEPVASRLHFLEDAELEELARSAGFRDATVRRPDLARYAVAVGLPKEVVAFFRSVVQGGQLLVAHKSRF
jgi:SAM-dependent methyltransferase